MKPTDWRNLMQGRYPPLEHQEQVEGSTLYLTYISSVRMGVYTTYWNTNPRVPYGERFSICTLQGKDK